MAEWSEKVIWKITWKSDLTKWSEKVIWQSDLTKWSEKVIWKIDLKIDLKKLSEKVIRKQLKICSVLSPGGVIQAFPEPESERGKILLLMVKNIDSCSRMRATFLFMNYPRDPKSLSSLSLKVRLKVATFLIINHPNLSFPKSLSSLSLKARWKIAKGCQHFPHLWKSSSLPRSRWITISCQDPGDHQQQTRWKGERTRW